MVIKTSVHLNCQNDWWALYGNQAVDHFGRLFQPKVFNCREWLATSVQPSEVGR